MRGLVIAPLTGNCKRSLLHMVQGPQILVLYGLSDKPKPKGNGSVETEGGRLQVQSERRMVGCAQKVRSHFPDRVAH